ncbi:hypothetical protein AeNC1_006253 [Aphanomyces euteiches]|nr:hypothetical protein AeNC1_006253 [Aphanomyces euteiches]
MHRQIRPKLDDDAELLLVSRPGIKSTVAKLPLEVVIKIAFLISGGADMLAFLEALRSEINLGPLEHLYQIGRTVHHSELWPSLWLHDEVFEALLVPPRQAILKYYSKVTIDIDGFNASNINGFNAIEWLKTHLNPKVTVDWSIHNGSEAIKNLEFWTTLYITEATITIDNDNASKWKLLLPHLDHLATLDVMDDIGELEDIYTFLPASKRVTNFKVSCHAGYILKRGDLLHLIQWFQRLPVRVFETWFEDWSDHLDRELRQEFCEAMFNCPTLERLWLADCFLYDMDFSEFWFSMKSLSLYEFDSYSLEFLAEQLEGSDVTSLSLVKPVDNEDNFMGMKRLFHALPRSLIKKLHISEVDLTNRDWCKLARLLQKSHLESLHLEIKEMTSVVARSFAVAIEKNHSIRQIHLYKCDIAVPDLKTLIRSISNAKRRVRAKRIIWTTLASKNINNADIRSLVELAAECGSEFSLERVYY